MNTVQIMGKLTRDPVMRATNGGQPVASFSVAVNRNYTMPNGEQKEYTDFINVVAWRALAEAAGNQLKKGMRVFVEGRYTSRSYTAPDGQKRYITEITANTIALPLRTAAANPAYDNRQGRGDWDQFGYEAQYQQSPPSGASQDTQEDIPF